MSQLGLLLLLTFHSNRLHTRTVYTVGKTPSKYALLCAIMIDSRQALIGEGRGFGRRRRVLEWDPEVGEGCSWQVQKGRSAQLSLLSGLQQTSTSLLPCAVRPLCAWKCAVLGLVVQSCLTLCNLVDCSLPGSSIHGDSPGKNSGMGSLSLLQGIFPTQESNRGLLHCRQILYQLSYPGREGSAK